MLKNCSRNIDDSGVRNHEKLNAVSPALAIGALFFKTNDVVSSPDIVFS